MLALKLETTSIFYYFRARKKIKTSVYNRFFQKIKLFTFFNHRHHEAAQELGSVHEGGSLETIPLVDIGGTGSPPNERPPSPPFDEILI